MLVPEIALTPQTVARFQARFGDTVALLHSALSEGERYDEWRRLRTERGPDRRRPAQRRLRADRQPRPDRPRRGARRLLQAGRRPALRRPPRRRLPRLPVGRAAGRRLGHAAPGDRPHDAAPAAPLARGRAARSRSSSRTIPRAPGVHRRRGPHRAHAHDAARRRPPARPHPRHARGPALAAPRDAPRDPRHAQVDRAAQPPRLVELPLLQDVREGVGVPALRRRARPAPRAARDRLPPLRPQGTRPEALRRVRLTRRRPPRRRHRARRARAARASSTSRSSAWTPTRRRPRTPSPSCSRASTRRRPACCSARRWSPRATTSRT